MKRKSTNKQQQHLPIGFTFTKCYISIDTSISNIRLKLLRVILDLNVWPKNTQHTAQTHSSNALSIYLRRFYLFHQIHWAWCRRWIVCYFVIFNTCSRTTDKRNKFHWFFFYLWTLIRLPATLAKATNGDKHKLILWNRLQSTRFALWIA